MLRHTIICLLNSETYQLAILSWGGYLSIDESLEEGETGMANLHRLTRLKQVANS